MNDDNSFSKYLTNLVRDFTALDGVLEKLFKQKVKWLLTNFKEVIAALEKEKEINKELAEKTIVVLTEMLKNEDNFIKHFELSVKALKNLQLNNNKFQKYKLEIDSFNPLN